MINLIPLHARKQVKIEYWVRVISVWMILLAMGCIVVSFLLVPSLVLIRTQLSAYGGEYQNANELNGVYDVLEQDVRTANTVAMKLVSANKGESFTTLLAEVQEIAKNKVTLQTVSFRRVGEKVETVNVAGVSVSRSALVTFRDALEGHELFESVELPLSNLAKDKDVPFSIVIVISNEDID